MTHIVFMPKVTYYFENKQKIEVTHHLMGTLLEASLNNGILHYHACSGNARCTTCRVRVLEGHSHLTPRTEDEQKLAQARNWPEEIRLACQAKLLGDVEIRRLVVDSIDIELIWSEECCTNTGQERPVVVMFCDIVNFTNFAAASLPYDVVYLLNRFYKEMCTPVLDYGGYIDKYMGDGLMVLFGLENNYSIENCLNAVQSSLQMVKNLSALNKRITNDFSHEFNIRIGLHYGLVIVGEIGHPSKRQLTALGDTVNVASRIESANKEFGTKILASQEMLAPIYDKVEVGKVVTTQLRGQNRSHTLYEILSLKGVQ